MTTHITLEETDVASDLDEGAKYTTTFEVVDAQHHPHRGPGNRVLKYRDATGRRPGITLWVNSTPEEVYETEFEAGETYTLTGLRYSINESGDRTFYNLTATADTEVRQSESGGDIDEISDSDDGEAVSGDEEASSVDAEEVQGRADSGTELNETDSIGEDDDPRAVSASVDEEMQAEIDDAFADVPESATEQTGHALTTFRSKEPLNEFAVHEYTLKAKDGYRPDDHQAALRDTYKARRDILGGFENTSPPVVAVRDALALATPSPLPVEELELEDFKIVSDGPHILDYTDYGDKAVTKGLIDASLRRILDGDYEVQGIDTVLSKHPVIQKQDFRLHERWNLSLSVTDAGVVYLSVDFRHKTISEYTLDKFDLGKLYRGLRVNVTYKESGKGAFVDELMDKTVNENIDDMGNQSVVEYHEGAERIPDRVLKEIARADRRVVKVTKQGSHNTEYYPQQLLALQGHPQNVKAFAPQFNEATRGKTRLSAQRCLNRATTFVENLPPVIPLGGATLSFDATPVNGDDTWELSRLFETDAHILQFAEEQTGDHPRRVKHNEVYEAPEEFSICLVHPSAGPHAERWENLERQLEDIGAGPEAVDRVQYDPFKSADEIYTDLLVDVPDDHEYSAACVILPKADFSMGESSASDIYHETKKALRQKRVDSQMAHIDTLATNYALPNVALGLVAAAGGIPFTTEDAMPGETDLFIGIDVSHRYPRDTDERVHIAASTTSIYGDGTILGYTSAKPQTGEKVPPKELKNLTRQSVAGYKQEHGEYPDHIVIHRDGFMREDLDPVEEMLESMDIDYDVVEVRKQSPARVLNLADGVAKVPDKGIAALNQEEGRAILATFGDPESQATSSNTGLPQPIQVERKAGDTDIETLTAQVYLLSQSHVGAVNSTARLPITTYYADRASEAAAEGYLPETSKLRQNIGFI